MVRNSLGGKEMGALRRGVALAGCLAALLCLAALPGQPEGGDGALSLAVEGPVELELTGAEAVPPRAPELEAALRADAVYAQELAQAAELAAQEAAVQGDATAPAEGGAASQAAELAAQEAAVQGDATAPAEGGAALALPRTSSVPYNTARSGERYVAYVPGGGWGNQIINLVCAVNLARRTNRALVVPAHAQHTGLYPTFLRLPLSATVPMDQVVDLSLLANKTGVRVLPLNVTLLSWLQTMKGRTRTFRLPAEGLLHPKSASVFTDISHLLVKTSSTLVYLKGKFMTAHWLSRSTLSAVRYAPFLQDMARTIQEVVLGPRFNAIHIRLGDVMGRAMRGGRDARHFAANARALGFTRDVPLYVSAEEPRQHPYFSPLLASFDRVVFLSDLRAEPALGTMFATFDARTPPGKVRSSVLGMVEQLLCVRASLFLGTRLSTFSMRIQHMRFRVADAIPELAHELSALPEPPLRRSGMVRYKGGAPQDVVNETLG